MTLLTDRYTAAVDYARVAHAAQVKKGTAFPTWPTCSASAAW
jgi:hypothetical protein